MRAVGTVALVCRWLGAFPPVIDQVVGVPYAVLLRLVHGLVCGHDGGAHVLRLTRFIFYRPGDEKFQAMCPATVKNTTTAPPQITGGLLIRNPSRNPLPYPYYALAGFVLLFAENNRTMDLSVALTSMQTFNLVSKDEREHGRR
ncbi:hypothetical protein C8R31_102574 [Nitrosospira sp. Nsp2]|nr:hypothetical protein C8R31_102574 [Nitrosospira sp. Nsp2]